MTKRPVCEQDLPFLERLYGSTREEELAQTPWSDDQKRQFVAFQFQAQHKHYNEHFPNAEYSIVESEGKPIGRLYVDRRADEIRLIDIALMPEYRCRGLGTALLADLIEESKTVRLPLTIHVEHMNPALGLYERLGFRKIEEHGIYFLMQRPWDAASRSRSSRAEYHQ